MNSQQNFIEKYNEDMKAIIDAIAGLSSLANVKCNNCNHDIMSNHSETSKGAVIDMPLFCGSGYNTKREHIRTGDVVLVSGTKLFSRVIKFFSRSKISHVGLFVWMVIEGEKRLMVVEFIEGQGMNIDFASAYLSKNKEVYWGRLYKPASPEAIGQKIFQKRNASYDLEGALLSLVSDTKTSNLIYCSEFIAFCHNKRRRGSSKGIIPDDIALLCEFMNRIEL